MAMGQGQRIGQRIRQRKLDKGQRGVENVYILHHIARKKPQICFRLQRAVCKMCIYCTIVPLEKTQIVFHLRRAV